MCAAVLEDLCPSIECVHKTEKRVGAGRELRSLSTLMVCLLPVAAVICFFLLLGSLPV